MMTNPSNDKNTGAESVFDSTRGPTSAVQQTIGENQVVMQETVDGISKTLEHSEISGVPTTVKSVTVTNGPVTKTTTQQSGQVTINGVTHTVSGTETNTVINGSSGQYVSGHQLSGHQLSGQYHGSQSVSGQYHGSHGQQVSTSHHVSGNQYNGSHHMSGQHNSGSHVVTGVSGHQTITSQQQMTGNRFVSGSVTESRVVGHEFGPERIISVVKRVDETKSSIVGERYITHEVRVPKRIVKEEIIEKVIVIPERILQEEIIEEIQLVKQKIIEIAKPIIVEKVVEVPEYEYVEKIIEVTEKIYQERIKEVEKIHYQDRIQHVDKIIQQEKIVEVADVQYRDVEVEKVVHVDDWRDEIIIKEVPITQYVDKFVPNTVQVENIIDVERVVPVPVEAEVTYEYRVPHLKPRYHKVSYPVYLPRFIEVPCNVDLLDEHLLTQVESYLKQVNALTSTAASLCEIETLAAGIMRSDLHTSVTQIDAQAAIMKVWQRNGALPNGLPFGGTAHSGNVNTTSSVIHTTSAQINTTSARI